MRGRILAVLFVLAPVAAAAAPAVTDNSFKDANGARVLSESVVVGASLGDVWGAFTTDAGFMKWAVPVAHIVPGNGGSIEFALGPNGRIGNPGNVRHRIDLYEPNRMLIFHNEFVPGGGPFDPAAFGTVRTILTFDDLGGGQTRVTETVVGFGSGAVYNGLYEHLRGGNAEYLAMMCDNLQKKAK